MSSEKTFTSPFGCVGGCPHCVELCRRIRRAVVSEQTQDLARGIRGAWDPIGDVQSHLMELSRRVDALEATLPRAKARELNEAIQESEPECTCYEYHGGHQPGCPMAPMPAPAPPVKSRGMEVAEICRTARGKINDLHYAAKIGGDVCQQLLCIIDAMEPDTNAAIDAETERCRRVVEDVKREYGGSYVSAEVIDRILAAIGGQKGERRDGV